jgi:hypothetical protein
VEHPSGTAGPEVVGGGNRLTRSRGGRRMRRPPGRTQVPTSWPAM